MYKIHSHHGIMMEVGVSALCVAVVMAYDLHKKRIGGVLVAVCVALWMLKTALGGNGESSHAPDPIRYAAFFLSQICRMFDKSCSM